MVLACLLVPGIVRAQGFYDFIPAVPQLDSAGAPLTNANTTFADGTTLLPAGDEARNDKWAWRPFGNGGILSSLGPSTSTPPSGTKELVTTVAGLEPNATYAVKVLFWSQNSGLWGVRAGTTNANGNRLNPWFNRLNTNVVEASYLPWAEMPFVFEEGGRTLFAATLGTATANNLGQVKVFVHDLPATDSNQRTWYDGVAVSRVTENAEAVVETGADGVPFHRGVRGLALADVAITRGEYHVGIPRSLEVARGSAIRGVATGLAADLYDWRTRNGQPRPPTLEFLRYSRDFDAELFLGANMRGLVQPDPNGGFLYHDTDPATLASLAADWVRYVNHIVPTYRQGDPVSDPRDAAILNSLTWSSAQAGDAFDTLLAPSEPAVPWIEYWEIGNEPTIGVSSFSVNNSYTLNPTNYHFRYKAIARAIKSENLAVKVGPTLVHAGRESAHLEALVSDPEVPIDFITYHPYEKLGLLDDPAAITLHLGSVHSHQRHYLDEIKRIVAASGRSADAIEYATTEVNVSNWDTNDSDKEARMAHALGTVETVFSHARLGLVASHYWIWPTHRWDGTEYPVFKAYEKLRDHMGDTLLSVYAFRDVRVYVTRDSRTGQVAIWSLNFSNFETTPVSFQLQNLPAVANATLHRLQDVSGVTTLHSANYSSEMPGGRAIHVEWVSNPYPMTAGSSLELTLPAATISLLVINPAPGGLTSSLVGVEGDRKLEITCGAVPYAAEARYQLQASNDLLIWEDIGESEAALAGSVTFSTPAPFTDAGHCFYRVRVLNSGP